MTNVIRPTAFVPQASAAVAPTLPVDELTLTIERDPPRNRRLYVALSSAAFAALLLYGAWEDVASRRVGGLLGVGVGRLARLAETAEWPGAWLVSALEHGHYAFLFISLASVLWFGATQRAVPMPQEKMIFHRRQTPWIAGTPAAGGVIGLAIGQWLISQQVGVLVDILAGLIEMAALSLLAGALWQALVPEARICVSVIIDRNMGWGNRVLIYGGMKRFLSRLTITKDALEDASARDIGGFEYLVGARTLEIRYVDGRGQPNTARVRGISHDPEIGVLASIIGIRLKRALTSEGLNSAIRLNRIPPQAGF